MGNRHLDSAPVIGGNARLEVECADGDRTLLPAHLDLQSLGRQQEVATLKPFADPIRVQVRPTLTPRLGPPE